VQVPTLTIVMFSPDVVQIDVVDEEIVTVNPADEVGVTAKAVEDHARSAGSANVTVWSALLNVIKSLVVVSDPDE
jgi:hypothetical protein